MSAEFICDGCGKRQLVPGTAKPSLWFERRDKDGVQLACSRECIDKVAQASGKARVVMPW